VKLFAIWIVAWLLGIMGYVLVLYAVFDELLHGGDLRAVLFYSCLVSAVAGGANMMVMDALASHLRRLGGWWAFPVVGVVLSAFPITLLGGAVGGIDAFLLFAVMFVVFGVAFGIGYNAFCRDRHRGTPDVQRKAH
jgi:hypothetical protein